MQLLLMVLSHAPVHLVTVFKAEEVAIGRKMFGGNAYCLVFNAASSADGRPGRHGERLISNLAKHRSMDPVTPNEGGTRI